MRLAVSRSVAVETSRGWRIAKEKASHKIDVVVALAMAALGAVRQGQQAQKLEFFRVPFQRAGAIKFVGTGVGLGKQGRIDAADDAAQSRRRSSQFQFTTKGPI